MEISENAAINIINVISIMEEELIRITLNISVL